MIGYTDGIYLEFGADKKVEGVTDTDAIKRIRTKAILAGLKLVDCPIRHLGTEKAQTLYLRVENALKDGGVNIIFNAVCKSLTVENDRCTGAEIFTRDGILSVRAQKTVVATGRIGEDWLETECRVHNVKRSAGPVDIGVRVEVRNEIMEEVNEALYESKLIGYPEPYRDKVRTFCQNPGGFVSQENYANGLAVVNGHSFKDVKSDNTNLAILSSHHFMIPFDRPTEYAKKTGELCNMLGDGKILVQRLGDITNGKRTWQKELARSNIVPTLKDAVAGDITSAMPFRAMSNILSFINAMDKIVPGFAGHETLLYSPEIKFYSNKIELDSSFQTNIEGLYALGDSSGWTRGLMMASVMGVIMGQKLA
ncbi:MAG: FAD-binding protein, partial [Clostridiales bacterium]|jgi:uncharacterized FAD-dependent dehydrogenase|nr:FAD-binding protein [Clostridiales bacterium]